MLKKTEFTPYTILATAVATLGSFLYGFQTAVISGVLPYLSKHFSLTVWEEGFVVSILLLGAIIGVIFAGTIADRFGRKRAILLPAFLFFIGTMISSYVDGIAQFMIGRFITGFAVGLSSITVPLYLAEIAPAKSRGAFVSIHQLVVTVGVLVAYIVNYYFSTTGAWRDMISAGLIPAAAQFFLVFFICDSPSWLHSHGFDSKAIEALKKLRKEDGWQEQLDRMTKLQPTSMKVGWGALLSPKLRHVVILGVVLNMFSQITGINSIIYYTPKIFAQTGYNNVSMAIFASIGIGVINVLASILSVYLLDKIGRKALLLFGIAGMAISLLVLSTTILLGSSYTPQISLISLIIYVGGFAVGLGPVSVVLISELYPLRIRGRAMGIATMSNWCFNYALSLVFLDLMTLFGAAGVFLLYAVLSIASGLFVHLFIPETKGKTLEEIEASLHQ